MIIFPLGVGAVNLKNRFCDVETDYRGQLPPVSPGPCTSSASRQSTLFDGARVRGEEPSTASILDADPFRPGRVTTPDAEPSYR
jgi:hypothetical protein